MRHGDAEQSSAISHQSAQSSVPSPQRSSQDSTPAYRGRLASEESPGYRDAPPPTRDEAVRTAGVRIVPGVAYGFFTDSTVCIGCKACEAACKQWNRIPVDLPILTGHSYDNTGSLGANTWRHVAFIEQFPAQGTGDGGRGTGVPPSHRPTPKGRGTSLAPVPRPLSPGGRWLFLSDVCKHCENAGCLEACPTGAIVRTEFGSVLIQQDVCNGCRYCVASCPFGVITTAEGQDNLARKCTLCYDRLKIGVEPACAKSCPTDSIRFGPVEALREQARSRVEELHRRGQRDAYLYGVPGTPGATRGVGSLNCFFLLTDGPEVYNLPTAPELPSRRVIPSSVTAAGTALLYGIATALVIHRARRK